MVSKELAYEYFNMLRESAPLPFINKLGQSDRGLECVLCYLDEHNGDVYANSIADEMNISRARIGVIVEKLVKRGLVEKTISTEDARIQHLTITFKGKDFVKQVYNSILQKVMAVVDSLGEEEFLHFIALSKKIKNFVEANFVFEDIHQNIDNK